MAQVAADMLMLLCDHVDVLLSEQPDVPRRIVEVITNSVIAHLLPSAEKSNSEDDKRVRTSFVYFHQRQNCSFKHRGLE